MPAAQPLRRMRLKVGELKVVSIGTNRSARMPRLRKRAALECGGVHQAVGQFQAVQAEQLAALVTFKLFLAVRFHPSS